MLSNCSIWRSSSIGVSVCLPFCLSFFLRFLLSFCGIFNNVQTSKSYVQKLSLGRKNLLFYFFTILCLHGCNLTKSIFHLLFPNLVYFALFSFSHFFCLKFCFCWHENFISLCLRNSLQFLKNLSFEHFVSDLREFWHFQQTCHFVLYYYFFLLIGTKRVFLNFSELKWEPLKISPHWRLND